MRTGDPREIPLPGYHGAFEMIFPGPGAISRVAGRGHSPSSHREPTLQGSLSQTLCCAAGSFLPRVVSQKWILYL